MTWLAFAFSSTLTSQIQINSKMKMSSVIFIHDPMPFKVYLKYL